MLKIGERQSDAAISQCVRNALMNPTSVVGAALSTSLEGAGAGSFTIGARTGTAAFAAARAGAGATGAGD